MSTELLQKKGLFMGLGKIEQGLGNNNNVQINEAEMPTRINDILDSVNTKNILITSVAVLILPGAILLATNAAPLAGFAMLGMGTGGACCAGVSALWQKMFS